MTFSDAPDSGPAGYSGLVERRAVAFSRRRIALITTGFMFLFVVLAGRAADLALLGRDLGGPGTAARGEEGPRARIFDRRGVMLAVDAVTPSLYAEPHRVWDIDETVRQLNLALPELDPEVIAARLKTDSRFVWLARNLSPEQEYAVHRLGLPGLGFRPERRRLYPHGPLASHVVGWVDHARRGAGGVERQFDNRLRSNEEPLTLSIDIRVQHVLRDEIQASMERFSAIGGGGLVMDVHTGEILGLVALPDFDPHRPDTGLTETALNRMTRGVYELGSTFKAFTTALALENGQVTLNSMYDVSEPLRYGRFRIDDYHSYDGALTVEDIFIESSNIGTAKMLLDVGIEKQKAFLGALGLLDPLPVELPATGDPLLPERWAEIQAVTISYGHGLSVTPLHLAAAAATLVNGGYRVAPTLVRGDGTPRHGAQILSTETSQTMRYLLRRVVEVGTGKQAEAPGWFVGGKTGTAEKPGGRQRGYLRKSLISSFLAVYPTTEPRYVVVTLLDEPKGIKETYGYATAGWTAAPAAGKVIGRIGPILAAEEGWTGVEARPPEAQERLTPPLQAVPAAATIKARYTP